MFPPRLTYMCFRRVFDVVSLGQEPLFTNFAGPPSNFIGTLDYLFFSHRHLTVTQARSPFSPGLPAPRPHT